MLRTLFLAFAMLLPWRLKILYYRLFGWKIGRGVRIGFSFIDAVSVEIGEGARIGHFNIFRGLRVLRIGNGAYISNLNQIFGAREHPANYPCVVEIGGAGFMMSRHFIDGVGRVRVGDRVTFGGREAQIWSHSRSYSGGRVTSEPLEVVVGSDVYLGARSMLLGCTVPARAVVGAGSVVTKSFESGGRRVLIAGNPAAVVKEYEENPSGSA
jgi:acetyltransferase-like isoleucine patch superfamily enzyme